VGAWQHPEGQGRKRKVELSLLWGGLSHHSLNCRIYRMVSTEGMEALIFFLQMQHPHSSTKLAQDFQVLVQVSGSFLANLKWMSPHVPWCLHPREAARMQRLLQKVKISSKMGLGA